MMKNSSVERNIEKFISELKSRITFNVNMEFEFDFDVESYYYDNDKIKSNEVKEITGELIMKFFYDNELYNIHLNHEKTIVSQYNLQEDDETVVGVNLERDNFLDKCNDKVYSKDHDVDYRLDLKLENRVFNNTYEYSKDFDIFRSQK